MIKIEKERKYNDFEKEVIKIIVNFEPIAINISFKEIYIIIRKNLFYDAISFSVKDDKFGILKTYKQKDDKLHILYLNFSSKIKNLSNLLVSLENSNLIKFHSEITTDSSFNHTTYTQMGLDTLGIKEDVKIISEKLEKCVSISYELKDLVKRNFMTDEEIRFNKQLTRNTIAIIISILALVVNIYFNWKNSNKKSNPKTELIITDETKKNMVEILNKTDKEDISKKDLLEIIKNLSKENPKEQNKKIEAKK